MGFSSKLAEVEKAMGENAAAENFEKCIYIFVSIAKDKDTAYETLDRIKHAIIWPDVIEEAGYDLEIEPQYKGLSYTSIMPNDQDMLARFRQMGENTIRGIYCPTSLYTERPATR